MSWINPITDLDIAMQGKNVTYIDLEVFGLPTNTQEGLVSAVESLTTSITDKVTASDVFTPVEREFLQALMATVADNGLEDGNEYKQLPQPKSPVEMIEQILTMDAPARTRLVLLGHVIASDSKLASAYAKQFDQLQTEYAVQQTTQKEGFDK